MEATVISNGEHRREALAENMLSSQLVWRGLRGLNILPWNWPHNFGNWKSHVKLLTHALGKRSTNSKSFEEHESKIQFFLH